MIRSVTPADAAPIAHIYNHYVAHTTHTFEEAAVSPPQMHKRIRQVTEARLPWLVAEAEDGEVTGYAYATRWKDRAAYRYAAEISVYLSPSCVGQGLGTTLYGQLFPLSAARGLRTLIAGITLPNPVSVALHEKFTMTQCARLPKVGFKFEQWLDVGYWIVDLHEHPPT
ncbi:MAG: N-acetyltransferase family protein [Pseudomonadota bacterium]